MISDSTVEQVVEILLDELDMDDAIRLCHRLSRVPGNKSFRDSMGAVCTELALQRSHSKDEATV